MENPKYTLPVGVQSVQLVLKIICYYSVEHSHARDPAISYLAIYPRNSCLYTGRQGQTCFVAWIAKPGDKSPGHH